MVVTRIVGCTLLLSASAFASLIAVGTPGPDVNNSIQASTRILEFQNTGLESGCIQWNGAADVSGTCTLGGAGFTGGNEGPQSQTRTAGALGITSGADLRMVFDAVEPGGNSITLTALRLLVLNPTTGALIFSADLAAPVALATTLQGTGQSDLLIRLDDAQAAAFDTAVTNSGLALSTLRIGAYGSASDAAGGPEAVYVGNRATFDPPPGATVPEPGTYMLMACGLLALGAFRRKA